MKIEEYLSLPVKMNGDVVIPNTLPIDRQVQYLIDTNFELLAHPSSKLWRLQNLFSVMDKNAKKVLFILNKAQRHFVTEVLQKGFKRIIILKSRQLGFTTLIAIYFLDEIIFNPNNEALQVAHTLLASKEIFQKKIKYAINNLCEPLKQILTISQMRAARAEFSYPDKSTSAISTAASGRSGTYRLLHVSELAKLAKAYPDKATEVITGTIPSVPIDGTIIIESTAEGQNSIFYEMYMTAYRRRDKITPQLSKAEFYPVFYNWTWDEEEIKKANADGGIPVADMEEGEIPWAIFQQENNLSDAQMTYYYVKWVQSGRDINKLHQEFPLTEMEAFVSTGANFFNLKKINDFYNKIGPEEEAEWKRFSFSDGKLIQDYQGNIYIKEEPQPGKLYVGGGDVAQGLSTGDYSTFFILGADKRICLFFRGHIEPDEYSKLVRFLGTRYNYALLGIESNADGNWVNSDIVNNGYPNIYLRTSFDDITKTTTQSYGWRTDVNTRKNMLDGARVHFNSLTELNCKPLLQEMMIFVRNKRGKPEAALGRDNHDDLIIGWAIAIAILGTQQEKINAVPKTSFMHLLYTK